MWCVACDDCYNGSEPSEYKCIKKRHKNIVALRIMFNVEIFKFIIYTNNYREYRHDFNWLGICEHTPERSVLMYEHEYNWNFHNFTFEHATCSITHAGNRIIDFSFKFSLSSYCKG